LKWLSQYDNRFNVPLPRDRTLEVLLDLDGQVLVVKRRRGMAQDHSHRLRAIKPYSYRDAATLLADFWKTVDAVLRERGVIS
jgi:hypothetical protein